MYIFYNRILITMDSRVVSIYSYLNIKYPFIAVYIGNNVIPIHNMEGHP